ncbi:hypothetical protein JTE90_016447 [Oedothorax gibbosus]|uniref:Uncharacterized protein n=1 Tax=Oedothorax gibbosus TaxID=931172 RepID=A0AAV6V697_9ARAC|nr:hypothetical protein JTE90_016447 [Oedothorax gibbosus]
MDSNASNYSPSVDSIQKSGISRRGGVRVRGGRLPPIRIRDSALTPTSTKKTFEPKIPQRRIKAKEEEP